LSSAATPDVAVQTLGAIIAFQAAGHGRRLAWWRFQRM